MLQAAPKPIGQVPYRPLYPRGNKSLHPSQPLPQRLQKRAGGSVFTFLLLSSLILTSLALLNLSEKALVTQNTYRIERIKEALEAARFSQEKLETEITSLKTPERIQRVATDNLSMVTPTEITFISLPAEEESVSYARLPSKEARE